MNDKLAIHSHIPEELEDEIIPISESGNQQMQGGSMEEGIELFDQIKSIHMKLDSLQSTLDEQFDKAASHTDMVKLLHEDMNKYRDEFWYRQITSRIIDDLLRFYDDIVNTLLTENIENLGKDDLIHRLDRFRKQLLRILGRQDVLLIDPIENALFDEAIHNAVELKAVATEAESGRVADIFQDGFTYRGMLLRPQKVSVTHYHIQEDKQEQS